ncbi:hypothetical protein [Thermogladius sp.]|uniref:hypothetical protein n=1 Tax=Thermogladius sp. TaxID=2023064 RepID=UPI003D0F5586
MMILLVEAGAGAFIFFYMLGRLHSDDEADTRGILRVLWLLTPFFILASATLAPFSAGVLEHRLVYYTSVHVSVKVNSTGEQSYTQPIPGPPPQEPISTEQEAFIALESLASSIGVGVIPPVAYMFGARARPRLVLPRTLAVFKAVASWLRGVENTDPVELRLLILEEEVRTLREQLRQTPDLYEIVSYKPAKRTN